MDEVEVIIVCSPVIMFKMSVISSQQKNILYEASFFEWQLKKQLELISNMYNNHFIHLYGNEEYVSGIAKKINKYINTEIIFN